jgi:AraC family transcriptional regulator
MHSTRTSHASEQVLRYVEPESSAPIGPLEWFKMLPFDTTASSHRLGWTALEAVRNRAAPASELNALPLTHHRLVLVTRPPEEWEMLYEGVKRHIPPPTGSISLVPAGSPALWRWRRTFDSVHIFLEPGLVARVGAEAFGLDPARLTVQPLDALELPQLRAAISAVDAELTAGGVGGPLAAESLANVLAVQLIRHIVAPRRTARGRDGALPRVRLRAVVEHIEDHLDTSPTLEEMAGIARVSPYHFARQFKTATGLPPHQYVIMRRIERARQLLQADDNVSLAQVAAIVGFSDQSHLTHHFKRLVGVTPGQFRKPARMG